MANWGREVFGGCAWQQQRSEVFYSLRDDLYWMASVGIVTFSGDHPSRHSGSYFSDSDWRGFVRSGGKPSSLPHVDHYHGTTRLIGASFYFILRVYAHHRPPCLLGRNNGSRRPLAAVGAQRIVLLVRLDRSVLEGLHKPMC